MNEIKFHGRGGQGVVMASEMLGLAFFRAGMYPQCYSLFGGERRGAPVLGFLRVDKEKILLKCEIRCPDELLCFDAGLFHAAEIRASMPEGGRLLVNTNRPPDAFQGLESYKLALIDAGSIAETLGLGHVINSTMLGAYCRLNGALSLDHVVEAVKEMAPAKMEMNVQAVRLGYERATVIYVKKLVGTKNV